MLVHTCILGDFELSEHMAFPVFIVAPVSQLFVGQSVIKLVSVFRAFEFAYDTTYSNKLLIYSNIFRLVIVFMGVEIARAPSVLIELLWRL